MDQRRDEIISEATIASEPKEHIVHNHMSVRQPRYLQVAWILLLLLGALFLLASLADLAGDLRAGIPSDHAEPFHALSGITWASAQQSASGITQYITHLEIAYAAHEMVFAVLFLIIVAIPFRRRAKWAWWACWVPMIANLTYTFVFARYSATTFTYSLIADIALPVLLLIHIPAFFGRSKHRSG